MNVVVHLFARAKDLAGAPQARLEVAQDATVAEVRRELGRMFPSLAGLLAHSAFAVNDEFASDETIVGADSELALLPPVSGG